MSETAIPAFETGHSALQYVLVGHELPVDDVGKCTRPGCKYERLAIVTITYDREVRFG